MRHVYSSGTITYKQDHTDLPVWKELRAEVDSSIDKEGQTVSLVWDVTFLLCFMARGMLLK